MSLHPGIARHLIPETPTILGRRLQPFTLWHSLILDALESPITFNEEEETGFADLQIAVHICCQPPLGPLRSVHPSRFLSGYQRARYAHAWEDELDDFREYLRHARRGPVYFEGAHSGTFDIRTSVQHYYVHKLMAAGYSLEGAWATSPGMARWILCNLGEVSGHPQEIRCRYQQDLAVRCGHRREDYPID